MKIQDPSESWKQNTSVCLSVCLSVPHFEPVSTPSVLWCTEATSVL